MPGPVEEVIVTPQSPAIVVGLEPVPNGLYSLMLLLQVETKSGLGEWVTSTASRLTPEDRERLELVIIGFHYAVLPERDWPSFNAYLDHLTNLEPDRLRQKLLEAYARIPPCGERDRRDPHGADVALDWKPVLESAEAYVAFLRERFDDDHVDEELERRAYEYVMDPPAMQALIVSYLRDMWERYLSPEWERTRPMLQNAVRACRHLDLSGMSRLEAARSITGQELEGKKWEKGLEMVQQVVFVPSAHIGPYVGRLFRNDTLWVMFGARLPEGVFLDAPDLNRAEIVVRLNALADDTRLQILKLVSDAGEQRSQEIMERLDISQSATSRHLTQLSASGFLSERRCNGAKCYRLNSERVATTLRAVESFLLQK
jgi:DNA-binding transcriptional ArsR family regulator